MVSAFTRWRSRVSVNLNPDCLPASSRDPFSNMNGNPWNCLAGVYRVLWDDGIIFVRVPNYASLNRRVRGGQWCGFRYPSPVNYFTPYTHSRMAGDSGFHLELLNPLKIAIDDNIKAVLTKRASAN